MEDNTIHPLVELVLARMKSHPEEFCGHVPSPSDVFSHGNDRWWRAREIIQSVGTEHEKEVYRAAIREITMDAAQEWMIDELLNGEERRRAERDKLERETRLASFKQARLNAQPRTLQVPYTGATTQLGAMPANYQDVTNTYASNNVVPDTTSTTSTTSITSSSIDAIKKALGI